ncbi:hypothetical protein [Tissierella praeacuta]
MQADIFEVMDYLYEEAEELRTENIELKNREYFRNVPNSSS